MRFSAIISNLMRSRSRTALTMSGIAIGIFSVGVISAIGKTGTEIINRSLDDMGINSVLVEACSAGITLCDSDVEALENVDGISDAMPLMASVTECRLPSGSTPCMAWGVSNDAEEIISLKAIHGRLITDSDIGSRANVCVIDKEIAENTYGRTNIVGKNIELYIGSGYESFEIVGVATSGLSAVQAAMNDVVPYFVYLPYTSVQNICKKDYYDKIALLIDADSQSTEIIDSIAKCMEVEKGEKNPVAVNNLLSQKKQLDAILSTVTSALSLIAGISLIVSGISVMNSMLICVNERRREIGIKKSLGAGNGRIVAEFLAEGTLVTLIGSIIGAAAAILLCMAACALTGQTFYCDFTAIIISIVTAALIGMVSGSYPAYKAARLKPVDALKG